LSLLRDLCVLWAIQDELAEEVTEQYSGDEPVHEINRKSHSHIDREPESDTNRKLPYDEIAPNSKLSKLLHWKQQ